MSRIEQIIMEMEEYIESCKSVAFSSSKISVEKETILELINELRLKTPDEIKRYQKIIANKDAIIADAKAQAESIIAQAQVQTEQLINEHEIMQRAVASANDYVQQAQADAQMIIDQATLDANEIRAGAVAYTDDMMANLQAIIEHTIDTSKARFTSFIQELNNSREIVVSNRKELIPQEDDNQEIDIPDPQLVTPDLSLINGDDDDTTDDEE